jgi:hypothetical protein
MFTPSQSCVQLLLLLHEVVVELGCGHVFVRLTADEVKVTSVWIMLIGLHCRSEVAVSRSVICLYDHLVIDPHVVSLSSALYVLIWRHKVIDVLLLLVLSHHRATLTCSRLTSILMRISNDHFLLLSTYGLVVRSRL